MAFVDFELLLAPLWARVGPHESTFCAAVFESLFKRRFHDISAPGGDAQWSPAAKAAPLWGAGNSACEHAGGGYYVGFSTFQHFQCLCSPLSSD